VSAEDPGDVVRLRAALASLAGDEPHGVADAARIFDAVHGNSSAGERRAVVDELLTNPAALQAWQLARELPVDAVHHSADTTSWSWMSIAAAAVLAIGLGWHAASWRQAQDPPYRSVEIRTLASHLPPGAVLTRSQPVLRWSEIAGAQYRVRVFTADLKVLEESVESSAHEYTLSAETLRRIPPDGQVLWQVDARVPGKSVIVSPTFSIRVP
jgi:hypothetical protein